MNWEYLPFVIIIGIMTIFIYYSIHFDQSMQVHYATIYKECAISLNMQKCVEDYCYSNNKAYKINWEESKGQATKCNLIVYPQNTSETQ